MIFMIIGILCIIAGILVVFGGGAAICYVGWSFITNYNDMVDMFVGGFFFIAGIFIILVWFCLLLKPFVNVEDDDKNKDDKEKKEDTHNSDENISTTNI